MKQKRIRKMTFRGFILWILGNIVRQIVIYVIVVPFLLMPFINVALHKATGLLKDLQEASEINMWEFCKSEFEIVKELKVVKQILKKVK